VNVLFDLDGTLTDPGEGFANCVSHALSSLGCARHSAGEIRKHVGPPLQETLALLLEGTGVNVQDAVALYRERYGTVGYLENSVYPGIEPVLRGLQARGIALYLATSKPTIYARRILEHFGLAGFFRGVHGSELDGTRSAKIELIAHVLGAESLDPAQTTMVGDRAQDVAGALANGVRPIAALWGYGSRDELVAAGATTLCELPSDLLTEAAREGRIAAGLG
jgi:phosphoglycolate phosphatase